MKRLSILLPALLLLVARIPAADTHSPFRIRGTLPWHNFLSGPTAWNEEDYVRYLDRMQAYLRQEQGSDETAGRCDTDAAGDDLTF